MTMIASKAAMGLPLLADFMVMGTLVGGRGGAAIPDGVIAHFLVGIVDGVIFALVVSKVAALKLSNSGNALGLGVLYGFILWLVVFIPVMQAGFAPIMMAMMGVEAAMRMAPTILAIAFVEHILFGLSVASLVYLSARQ